MLTGSDLMFNIVIGVVGILLYAFLWLATRDFPAAAKIFARLALALVVIVPVALWALNLGQSGGARPTMSEPASAERERALVEEAAKNRERAVEKAAEERRLAEARRAEDERRLEAQRRANEAAAKAAGEQQAAGRDNVRGPSAPVTTAQPPAVAPPPASPAASSAPPPTAITEAPRPKITSVPPPEPEAARPRGPPMANGGGRPAPPGTPRSAAAPADAPTAGASPPTASGAAAGPQGDWQIVPVYYGTDRVREAVAERASYSSARGARLELGRALVSVPKVHEVPNIERPWVYKVPFTGIVIYQEKEDPRRHFTLREVRSMTREELVGLVRDRLAASRDFQGHAIVFVHGFNTSFDYALYRTAQIAYDLGFDGAPFVYSWPSEGRLGLQDYNYDRESAEGARVHFKTFLEMVARDTGASSVSVIAHSMGNQVVLPVLRELKNEAPAGVRISEVIFAAPDVSRDTFAVLARDLAGVARGLTLYASGNDKALLASRQLWRGERAGEVPPAGPLVLPGIDTIDVSQLSTDVLGLNHSGYAEKSELLTDIRRLVLAGTRPPNVRVPSLEARTTDQGAYWRYP
jgi:esterase/lipase superfamily enzyme